MWLDGGRTVGGVDARGGYIGHFTDKRIIMSCRCSYPRWASVVVRDGECRRVVAVAWGGGVVGGCGGGLDLGSPIVQVQLLQSKLDPG